MKHLPAILLAPIPALFLALGLAACGGPGYVHDVQPDKAYAVDRYNCQWDLEQQEPNLDGDEMDRRVEECLAAKGWKPKEEEKKEDSGWWPW